MMGSVLNCGSDGWLMLASGIAINGLLALGGAALVKYLFFADRPGDHLERSGLS
jgi:hypothetical protein